MSSGSFTTGPWVAVELSFTPGGPTHYDVLQDEEGLDDAPIVVAQYLAKGDACLIAAAPSMYAALTRIANSGNAPAAHVVDWTKRVAQSAIDEIDDKLPED